MDDASRKERLSAARKKVRDCVHLQKKVAQCVDYERRDSKKLTVNS